MKVLAAPIWISKEAKSVVLKLTLKLVLELVLNC